MKKTTWANLADLVLNGIPAVRVARCDLPADIPKWLAGSPLSLHHKADQVCARFVREKKWPPTSGDLRTLLFLRSLLAAEFLCSRASRNYPGTKNHMASHWAEHCLVSGWYHEWQTWSRFRFGYGAVLPFDPWSLN